MVCRIWRDSSTPGFFVNGERRDTDSAVGLISKTKTVCIDITFSTHIMPREWTPKKGVGGGGEADLLQSDSGAPLVGHLPRAQARTNDGAGLKCVNQPESA